LNINNLDFNGRLALVFGKGFTPLAGTSIDLFQFASFIGSFDPNRISVSGLDRSCWISPIWLLTAPCRLLLCRCLPGLAVSLGLRGAEFRLTQKN